MFSNIKIILACLGVAVVVQGQVPDGPIKFKLSGTGLKDKDRGIGKGVSDSFAEIFYTDNGNPAEVKVGTTSVLNDDVNPEWSEVFEFNFIRSKNQRLSIRLYDKDSFNSNDNMGVAFVNVVDFVTAGHLTVPVDIQGSVTIRKTNESATVKAPPLLKFKLSASGLDDRDVIGTSDPYVKVYYEEKGQPQKLLMDTMVIKNNENPSWPEIFDVIFDANKKQKYHFQLFDKDEVGKDETLGDAVGTLEEYYKNGEILSMNLKKGVLTMRKA